MKRNHIHLAQDVAGKNVVSGQGPLFLLPKLYVYHTSSLLLGMRTSSQILIYVDVRKALDAGIKFWLSDNGVVLTEGDDRGFLSHKFFEKVIDIRGGELHGWEET